MIKIGIASLKIILRNWKLWLGVHIALIFPIVVITYPMSNALGSVLNHRNMSAANFLHFDYQTFSDILNNYDIVGNTLWPILFSISIIYIITKTYVSSGIITLNEEGNSLNSFLHTCNDYFRKQISISILGIGALLLIGCISLCAYAILNGGLSFMESESDTNVKHGLIAAFIVFGVLSCLLSIVIDRSRIKIVHGISLWSSILSSLKINRQKVFQILLWFLLFIFLYALLAKFKGFGMFKWFIVDTMILPSMVFVHFILFLKTGLKMLYLHGLAKI